MKIEIWFDFFHEESHQQMKVMDALLKEIVIADLELLYRSYPRKENLIDTIDFHRLSHLAKKYHAQHEFNLLLSDEIEKQKMINQDALKDIAIQTYLDEKDINHVLSSNAFLDNVESNLENALLKKIITIPHIRIEGQIKLDGYQSKDAMIRALNLAKANIKTNEHCKGEHCGRKKAH